MKFPFVFIRRPVGTTLASLGLFLIGAVAYQILPVASLPTVDYPTIQVSAAWPGADPTTMARSIAAPLERQLSKISSLNEITSRSTNGATAITLQFDLERNIEGAARDVQAAINAALPELPPDLPMLPRFQKVNPDAAPLLILALTSETIAANAIYDMADTLMAQRISQVTGVAKVDVGGADQPAVRVRLNPIALNAMGLSMEDVRTAIANENAITPLGGFDGQVQSRTIATNRQIREPSDYGNIIVRSTGDAVVHLSAIATIEIGARNSRAAAWYNRQPAILIFISKQANANVVETVDRINALLPELRRAMPAGIQISVLADRTQTIRASVHDLQLSLVAAIILVMLLVLAFLRQTAATVAAGITIPLSLAGTCTAMWLAGFSINTLTLMALVVSVGFTVDDAIVMIENFYRNLQLGQSPARAAIRSIKQVGLTVITISISLFAAFIPLLFTGGVAGRLFREFSLTIAFSIAVSTLVSLSVTPMICAHFVRMKPNSKAKGLGHIVEIALGRLTEAYSRSLAAVLRHRSATVMIFLATTALTVALYAKTPKGYLPQDDTGFIYGMVAASPDISYETMFDLQQRATEPLLSDPAVAGVNSSIGNGAIFGATVNSGRLYISLKPLAERGVTTQRVIERLRPEFEQLHNARVFLFAIQELHVGGRQSQSQYQFTLWTSDSEELQSWLPRVQERIQQIPGIIDVSTDREQAGLQANVVIDRDRAASLGIKVQDIDNALNNAFSQRQISTVFTERNQYRVILEIDSQFQRDPSDLDRVNVSPVFGVQVPLSTVARVEKGLAPLAINHQGQFPAATISFNLAPNKLLDTAIREIAQAVAELHVPDTLHTEFSGDARAFAQNARAQPLLILAALICVYFVLGVFYESLAHPLTIISTLPSAALGALLALTIFKTELSIIAFIGIILLIGIVKKNGIMLVDFAIEGERKRALTPERAIFDACLVRFRPILMTNLAALLAAIPLVIASGPGSELRRPLGITIIGGLLVSQVLTLYTTPVIYLLLDRLHRRLRWPRRSIKP